MNSSPLITLITDYGTFDYFVGTMKAVILSTNPQARILDITHEIPPHDVEEAAFLVLAGSGSFPAGTINLSVVDPGVGSQRRPIAISSRGQFFLGPDNGTFSYILESDNDSRVFHLTNEQYFRHPISNTFQGRDIFAPVAAALSLGVDLELLGKEITDAVRLKPLTPAPLRNGRLRGRIIHIDRFGNCVTNFTPADLSGIATSGEMNLVIRGKKIRSMRRFFADAQNGRRLFGIWGSAGFLEIAAENRSAAKLLKARRGDRVTVT